MSSTCIQETLKQLEPQVSGKNVLIALSGGVDSAVTAWLCQEAGGKVHACHMQNWDTHDPNCQGSEDLSDAQKVCTHLHIPLHTLSLQEAYWDKVFTKFLNELEAGYTPNPDMWCNQYIKFDQFLEHTNTHGMDLTATGHYAQILNGNLHRAIDKTKDQTYFLGYVPKEQFQSVIFPLGTLHKSEIRALASHLKIPVAAKKDSTGICFIGPEKYRNFLSKYTLSKPGPIMTLEGQTLGKHEGLLFYTLGQRSGLGIGGCQGQAQAPWYVIDKDLKKNILYVGQGVNHPKLFHQSILCDQINILAPFDIKKTYTAKIRHQSTCQPCKIIQKETGIQINFLEQQRAMTPGQACVLYDGSRVIMGGRCTKSFS